MNQARKKILFTVENYYPKTSGVPVVVKYLAEGLQKTGKYEVCVATRLDTDLPSYEVINDVAVYRFDLGYNLLKKPKGDLETYIRFIENGLFDVIILECTQCVTTDAVLPEIDRTSAVVILHSHGFSGMALKPFTIMSSVKHTVGNTINYIIWKKYYQSFLPKQMLNVSECMCLSDVDNDFSYLERCCKKVSILPNAAEETFFKDEHINNLECYVDAKPLNYFICVAYYSDIKNQIEILKQYYKSRSSKDYAMVFIGTEENEYYGKLNRIKEKLDKEHGKRDVFLLVGIPRKDIAGIVSGASIYLSGSRREAFSISLVETMALGIPFVATNVGNASQLPGGYVIDKMDEMADRIDDLITSADIYRDFSIKGRTYAESNCQISVIVNRLEKIILGV